MTIVTAQEMQDLDIQTIRELGIPSLALMENAGVAVVNSLERSFAPLAGKWINIVSGTGNNGGDGFVIARHLLNRGSRVKVFLLGGGKLSEDCRHNREVYERLGGKVHRIDEKSVAQLKFSLSMGDVTIDAMLGTGATGAPRGILGKAIELINESKAPVIAVDIPSGVDGTTGAVSTAVRATMTVTFGFVKQGLLLYPGRSFCGEVQVADIGIPHKLASRINRFVTSEALHQWLPERPPWGHKGTFGHVLVIAGSSPYVGAARLASEAALKSGAGVVTVAVPQSIAHRLPPSELIVRPVEDSCQGVFGSASMEQLSALLEGKDAIVLGCGLSQGEETAAMVGELLQTWQGPLVLDADGINALANQKQILENIRPEVKRQWVVTPHPGEMSRFVGVAADLISKNPVDQAWSAYQEFGVNMVLKGAPTVIAGAGRLYVNSTGNDGMGSAGMGDVLAGTIGGLIAQGMRPFQAAIAGVYFHGLAGDRAAAQQGRRGMIASDVLQLLPEVLQGSHQKD